MKFKTLRTKREPKEFIYIDVVEKTMIIYTCEFPKPQPLTATLELTKDYYKDCISLPDQMSFDDMEMVEFEMYEVNSIDVNIHNEFNSCKTLISLLEEYFSVNVIHASEERSRLANLIKKEMKENKKNIEYVANLLYICK
jgi:hypothetical protein